MPKKNNPVCLSPEEIMALKSLTHKGAVKSARTIMHAHILLLTADNQLDKKKSIREVAELFDISPNTVNQVRKTYAESGLDAALNRKTRITPPHISKITGDFEARLIAAATGPVPKGRAHWTLSLTCGILHRKEIYRFNFAQYSWRSS